MQASDCLASDGRCMSGLSCAEIHRNAPISLCLRLMPECCARPLKGYWFLICCNREQERGMAMYFHKCMHASILVPPITHIDAWWPRGRIVKLYLEWMHMKTKLKPNSIMDNPECRWLGTWGTFRHSEYETSLVSRARANSYPKHNAISMPCMNATKIQPNMHDTMK